MNQSRDAMNIVDQKKKQSQESLGNIQQHSTVPENINIMIKTSYGGAGGFNGMYSSNPNSVMHSNVISKALAQQKLRKFR